MGRSGCTVQKVDFVRGDLAQQYPHRYLYHRIGIVVIQNRGGFVVDTDQREGIGSVYCGECVCQNPCQHSFLPGCCIWKQAFECGTLIRDVTVGAIGEFIQAVSQSLTPLRGKEKLEDLIVVFSVQAIPGSPRIGQAAVAFRPCISINGSCNIRTLVYKEGTRQ